MPTKKPRRLIVGDIHGCADELSELLFRFKFMPGHDILFTVGDVIGKGPKPREALELLRQFGARSVLGNHEAHCLNAAAKLSDMRKHVVIAVRTWDGKGEEMNRPDQDPPWFECVSPAKIVVFGHWALRGLVDLPKFKGLDSGCVYGRELTAWSPDDKKFHHVTARRAYAPIRVD